MIKIGVMGTKQIQHIIPILEKEYEVINLEELLQNNVKFISAIKWFRAMLKVDYIYNVYTSEHIWKKALLCKLFGKKIITHWIGTDAYNAIKLKKKYRYKFIDFHFACFESIQDELKCIDINSVVLPIFPYKMDLSLSKMPDIHACLIYMPAGKEEFYGFNVLKKIFSEFGKLKFYIVANDNKDFFSDFPNVEVLGELSIEEMNEIYNRISIVIRLPKHDGLSMSVIEALGKGKIVLWNYHYPYVNYVENENDIIRCINHVLETKPIVNIKEHEFISLTFNADLFLKIFKNAFENM